MGWIGLLFSMSQMRSWRCRHIKTVECRVAQPARRDSQYPALMGPWTPTLPPGWDGAYLTGELCEEDVACKGSYLCPCAFLFPHEMFAAIPVSRERALWGELKQLSQVVWLLGRCKDQMCWGRLRLWERPLLLASAFRSEKGSFLGRWGGECMNDSLALCSWIKPSPSVAVPGLDIRN